MKKLAMYFSKKDGSAAAGAEAGILPKAGRIGAVVGLAIASASALALQAPQPGTFGYDMYDIAVNQILNGPIGFVAGVAGVVYSATRLKDNWAPALSGVLMSSAVIQADAIATTLGMIV